MMSSRGQASWAKMMSPNGMLYDKKENKAEELICLCTKIACNNIFNKNNLTAKANLTYHYLFHNEAHLSQERSK